MRRIIPMLLAVGLAATWIGCQSATETDVTASRAGVDESTANESAADESSAGESAKDDFVLVTLKVPNMT